MNNRILISFDEEELAVEQLTSMDGATVLGGLALAYITACKDAEVDAREVLDDVLRKYEEGNSCNGD